MNTPTGPPAQSETRAGGGSGAAPPAPPRQTMQAIVQAGYGSADVLRRAEIDKPVIGDDEVLIRVQAAGLDRGTWHLMTGKPYLIRLWYPACAPPRALFPDSTLPARSLPPAQP